MELEINKNNHILCLPNEEWRDVIGYEHLYEVSNMGRIRTKYRVMYYDKGLGRGIEPKTVNVRIRKQKFNKHTGYLMVALNVNGKNINKTVHSMVAHAFHEYYEPLGTGLGKCTNHIDGNKLNNHASNLEVIDLADNVRHMFKTRLCKTACRVKYNGITYRSKSVIKKELGISERKLKKMILQREIEEID